MKIKTKKSLGQNFIFDKNFLNKISNRIISNKEKTIIEIGPGLGTLTEYLFKKDFKKLILIEKDDKLFKNLDNQFSSKNTKIINLDALDYDYQSSVNENSIIVGNLPFNISIELLYKWTKTKRWPPRQLKMILMFQKEVANRIIANPNSKSYGKLSVVVQSRYNVKKLFDVPSKIFIPKPKVDGTILEFNPHNNYKSIDINKIDEIAKLAFSQRRKKIKNTMSEHIELIRNHSIDENLRAENLSVAEFCQLARCI